MQNFINLQLFAEDITTPIPKPSEALTPVQPTADLDTTLADQLVESTVTTSTPIPEVDVSMLLRRDLEAEHSKATELEALLQEVLKTHELPTDKTQLKSHLENLKVQQEAKRYGIPEPLAKELNDLKAFRAQQEQTNLERSTNQQVAQVALKYQLDQTGIQQLMKQFVDAGINPFATQTDVETFFLKNNLATIVSRETTKAVEKERARLEKVQSQGSSINTQRSPNNSNSTPQPMDTRSMAELLRSISKDKK